MWLFNKKKIHFYLMRKNSYDRILKRKQYQNTIPKSCPN